MSVGVVHQHFAQQHHHFRHSHHPRMNLNHICIHSVLNTAVMITPSGPITHVLNLTTTWCYYSCDLWMDHQRSPKGFSIPPVVNIPPLRLKYQQFLHHPYLYSYHLVFDVLASVAVMSLVVGFE